MCGNDSINWITLSYQTGPDNIISTCLQTENNTDLTSGRFVYCPCYLSAFISVCRYYVAVEAVDYVGLSRVVCPGVSFVIDDTPPQFFSVMPTCLAVNEGGSIPLISWNISALSEIVVIRYNISATSTEAQSTQDFVQFPDAVMPVQLNYDLSQVLQGYSGDAYLTLQAESGVGLTNTNYVGSVSCTG